MFRREGYAEFDLASVMVVAVTSQKKVLRTQYIKG